jgi:putative ABC transport system ATP-binding protein
MPIAIDAENLAKTFYANQPREVRALRPATLRVEQGACVLLQGASGSGKTTLLTLLSCLAKPTSGEYRCLGQPVSRWSERFLTEFRRQHIGVVFQQFQLLPGFSAAHNISLPLWPLGLPAQALEARARQAAEQVNIGHRLQHPVEGLSGGEQQRVAIARALVAAPALLFADEPTAHLDAANADEVLRVFARLRDGGTTIVLTSHDPRVAAHGMIDRIIEMQDGCIVP